METANQPTTVPSSRSKQRNYLYDSQATQNLDNYQPQFEYRPEIVIKTPQFKTNHKVQDWPAKDEGNITDQNTSINDKPSKHQLENTAIISEGFSQTLQRDPKFNSETDVPESESNQNPIRDRLNQPQLTPASGQASNLPTFYVSRVDQRAEHIRNGNTTQEFSPEIELQDTREEIKRLKEDVEELKYKIDGLSSHNSSFLKQNDDQNQSQTKVWNSAYHSPSRSHVERLPADADRSSNLASDLDENFASIKQDLANILNSTKHLISPQPQPHLNTPSTSSSNRIAVTVGTKSGKSQQSQSPDDDYRSKERYYSSVSSPTFNAENKGDQQQSVNNPASENLLRKSESKSPDKIHDNNALASSETHTQAKTDDEIAQKTILGSANVRFADSVNNIQTRNQEEKEDDLSMLSKSTFSRRSREDPPDLSKNLERARSFSLTKRFKSRNSIAESMEDSPEIIPYGEPINTFKRSASTEGHKNRRVERANLINNDSTPNVQDNETAQAKSTQSQYQENIGQEETQDREELPFSWTPHYKDGRSPTNLNGISLNQGLLQRLKLNKHPNLSTPKTAELIDDPKEEMPRSPLLSHNVDKQNESSPQQLSQERDLGAPQPHPNQNSFDPTVQSEKMYQAENTPSFAKETFDNRSQEPIYNSQEDYLQREKIRENLNSMGPNFMPFYQQMNMQDGNAAANPHNLAMLAQMGVPWDYINQLLMVQLSQMQQEEMKNYMQFIMNFYEFHLANMKNIITNQNDTLSDQVKKIHEYAGNESQYVSKIITLEGKLKEQHIEHEKRYLDLNQRYETYMNEVKLCAEAVHDKLNHLR